MSNIRVIVLVENGMVVPEGVTKESICSETVIDHATMERHQGEVCFLNGDTDVLNNWMDTLGKVWVTHNPMLGWSKRTVEQNKEPQFRISKSEIDKFSQWYKTQSGLRYGQAFHQYFKLEKMVRDKVFCDRLYEQGIYDAKKTIASITDYSN